METEAMDDVQKKTKERVDSLMRTFEAFCPFLDINTLGSIRYVVEAAYLRGAGDALEYAVKQTEEVIEKL